MDIKKFMRDILANLIANLLLIVGGSVVIGLAFFQRLPLYQLLLLIIGTVGVVLWVTNQISIWKERHKRKLTKLADKELGNTIREWIDISAWKTRPIDLKDDLLLGYELTFANMPITISRQKKEPGVIYLVAEIQLTSQKAEMAGADWERFGGQISIEMARLGIMFNFTGENRKWEHVKLVEPVILDDALTGFYFRTRILFVIRALILVIELGKEALRQSEKSTANQEGSQS